MQRKESVPMAVKFPSEDWIKELEVKLNASESYAQAAATWEGDNIFVILPDADYADTSYFYINLQHGKASDARQLKSLDEQSALFISSAPFNTWRNAPPPNPAAVMNEVLDRMVKVVESVRASWSRL